MPKKLTVSDLKLDSQNRRERTKRGGEMLVESLGALGAGRSIVIDENNEVLAGNGVLQAAAEVGITALHVVETDGRTLVAVRRVGLSADEKRALALYDNRTAELAKWVPDQLAEDKANGLALTPWFDDKEQAKLLKTGGAVPTVRELETGPVADRFWIAVRGPLKQQAQALQRLRDVLKEIPGLEVDLGLSPETESWG